MSAFIESLGKPLAVNESGVQFWLDCALTDWAQNPDSFGTKLLDYHVFIVKHPNEPHTRMLALQTNSGNSVPIYVSPRMEDIASKIDIIKTSIRYDRTEKTSNPKAKKAKSTRTANRRPRSKA
jgi:hypothetical protein